MTWAKIIAGVVRFLAWITSAIDRAKAEDYGRLKERERQDKADEEIRNRIRNASPDRVSDDDAFGPG